MLKTRRYSIQMSLYAACGLALSFVLAAALPEAVASSQAETKPETLATPAPEVPVCAFCRAPQSGKDFCPRCGRLSQIVSTSSEHRFWADVPYILAFPPLDSSAEIQSEFSAQGLIHESVRFPSGDRYDLKMEKNGPVVHGRVGWMKGGKETEYTADMEDVLDDSQRIVARQVLGKLQGSSGMYLHRRLDYKYTEDGHLDRIEFKTWFYKGSSDWKNSPASWLRHSTGEILLRRDPNGMLTKIETTLRDGKRSLRGEPEYGEPRVLSDLVTLSADKVDRVTRSQ